MSQEVSVAALLAWAILPSLALTKGWWQRGGFPPSHVVTTTHGELVQLGKQRSKPGLPVSPNPKSGSCFPGSEAWRWSEICPRAIQDCWCPHSSHIDWCTHLCYIFEVTLIEAYIILSVYKWSSKRLLNMILVCSVSCFM